ncbi:Anti-sigma B factor antagonist [Thauera humireducens]|jgi:anti-anti-sigma factor|uniref:Anti-sigma B factor antagonist n=1 Tax=Thauera humireducens TaxID=1134435 RepID=A0A140ICR7_9RHOO|nr:MULTISPECIES: STAS domain-containing protein [Thauera]AMO35542.1 anti-sigma B factor antagonist [Thauera humireducens]ENO75532.1 STAS domain-containing protein [Thauera sp. 63]CAH1745414.1 Anti-sigma B factor antagonist [Thauera humireducens]
MATRKKNAAKRIAIGEDMTIYNAAVQKQALIDALAAGQRLEIDLSAVGEIDTAGFQLLMLVKREARRLGKEAQIVAHSEAVREVIDFYNMAAEFGDPLLIPAHKA